MTHRENFKAWYVDILDRLYPLRDAGFAILMIAFPLLERHLRQRVGLSARDRLSDNFYDELTKLFRQLPDRTTAKNFWQVYRNGILHEVTLSRQDRSGSQMPLGWLSHDKQQSVTVESDGSFWIHPVLFSQRVIHAIETEFSIYEGPASQSRLPDVKTVSNQTDPIILGTNTDS